MQAKFVCIIILHWNGYEDTMRCLRSLQYLEYPNYKVLLVDNGSSNDSFAKIQKNFPEHTYIATGANLGYAQGNNLGIDHALRLQAEYIFLLNNDTTVEKDSLCQLVMGAQKHPKGKIFGPKVLQLFAPNIIDHMGGMWDEKQCNYIPFAYKKQASFFQENIQLDYICGCSIFINSDIFLTTEKLDSRFFLLWEESDFCARVKKQGLEIWAIANAVIYHKGSSSFSGKAHLEYYWHRNRLLWMEKHVPKSKRCKKIRYTFYTSLFKPFRHYFLKRFLWEIYRFFPAKRTKAKKMQLNRLYASCLGICDYYRRKFYKTNSTF